MGFYKNTINRNCYIYMKRSIIIFSWVCMMVSHVFSQSSHGMFVSEGKQWRYEIIIPSVKKYSYVVHGDTVISNHPCKKVYMDGDNYYAAIYESDGKVFQIPNGSGSSSMLYDFNIKVGDSIHRDNGGVVIVSSIDSVWCDGVVQPVRAYTLKYVGEDGEEYCQGRWAEGVGALDSDLFQPLGFLMVGNYSLFNYCTQDGEYVFYTYKDGYEEYIRMLGVNHMTLFPQQEESTIYDLQGRRVLTPQRGGLYIRGGRKFVCR